MAPRDRWIGWSDQARRANLSRVVNNARFLILPWVEVLHLASHVLSLAARRLPTDWQAAYGVEPVLLETLVDRPYTGTCYRAANWICVGQTQGRGRMDSTHEAQGTSKDILLYPLESHWRQRSDVAMELGIRRTAHAISSMVPLSSRITTRRRSESLVVNLEAYRPGGCGPASLWIVDSVEWSGLGVRRTRFIQRPHLPNDITS